MESAHAGLMGHEMPRHQEVGLAANALALMARAVVHHLRVANSELVVVGRRGFEPLTSCVSSRRSNQAELTAPSHAG